jgi:hypothetical protein
MINTDTLIDTNRKLVSITNLRYFIDAFRAFKIVYIAL